MIMLRDMCYSLCISRIENNETLCFPVYQTYNQLSFITNFQNADQYTGGKWLIDGKDNQL